MKLSASILLLVTCLTAIVIWLSSRGFDAASLYSYDLSGKRHLPEKKSVHIAITNEIRNEPQKTKYSERLAKRTTSNITTEEFSEILKRNEAKRLKSIKMVETDSDYKFHAVFNIPSNEEESEIRRVTSKIPNSDYDILFGNGKSFDGPESLLADFGVIDSGKNSEYYIVSITISKTDQEKTEYETIPVGQGNLSYDKDDIPSGGVTDYLNSKKHVKKFDVSRGGRFSEIITEDTPEDSTK